MTTRTLAVVSAGLSAAVVDPAAGRPARRRDRRRPCASAASTRRSRSSSCASTPATWPTTCVTGFPNASLRAALDTVAGADGADRRHADLLRLLQRAVQDVLRRRSTRTRWPASRCCSARPAARPGTRWRSSTRCGRCSPTCARSSCRPRCSRRRRTGARATRRTVTWSERIERAAGELADLVARRPAAVAADPFADRDAVRGAAPRRLTRLVTGGGDGQRGLTEPTPLIFRVTWGLPMYWTEPTPSTVAFRRVLTRTTALAAPSTVTSAVALCRFSPS